MSIDTPKLTKESPVFDTIGMLNFLGLSWPHVSVATLKKTF